MKQHGYGSVSAVLGVLVLFCNREHNARKAIIFRKPVRTRTGTRALVLAL